MNEHIQTFTTHTYKIDTLENRDRLLTEFKSVASRFLAYIKQLRPKPELKQCGGYLLEYQHQWFVLIKDILTHNNHTVKAIDINKYTATYEQIVDILNLEIVIIRPMEYYKNIWGPVYWSFLHLTSIFCSTEYQKDLFSTNLLNFNLCMMCGTCAFNFKDKKPFMLMLMMTLTQDMITPIFNLHNIVNTALKQPEYSFEVFVKKYNLIITSSQTNTLTHISSY